LAEQRVSGEEPGRELSKKEEREQRILDAAAELLERWGYRKTTLEDIARRAGVAKPTIYLSWKTREALFMALIEREQAAFYGEIVRRMEKDPEGMTLPGLVKHSILATLKNPLMKALATRDVEFLGELATHEHHTAAYQAQMQSYAAIMSFLRELGVIRSDVDLREQSITFASVTWGFLLVDPLLPADFKLTDEQMGEQAYTTLKRLLEPDIPPSEEQRREGKKAFRAYMEQVVAIVQDTSHEAKL
jgi:AcrR family transcriptional regulator